MADAHDMVYILSEDYWGFDPATRDDSLNFYTNVWTLPKTQYDSMSDEDDRRKLYRCALFYVVDKTDNHGFTPIAIQSQGNTVIVAATAAGGGINKRMYNNGTDAGYETGSIVMRQADSKATTFEELQDMQTNVPGKFQIEEFIFDDEAAIKSKVEELQEELGQINAAETGVHAAEVTGAPQDAALDVSMPLAANPSTASIEGADLITDVQDTSLNLFAEYETANLPYSSLPGVPVVANSFGEDSSLAGKGVPEWYGADSDDMTPADKLALKRKRVMESKMRGINRRNARKDKMDSMMAAEQTANLSYSNLPAVPVVPNTYGEDSSLSGNGVPEWYGSAEHDQGYDDKQDESMGMRHRGSHSQSMKDRRDEASAMDKDHSMMGRKYDDVMTMDAQGYNDKMDESLGMRHRGSHSQSMKDRRDEASAMDKMHSKMGRKYDDVMTMDSEHHKGQGYNDELDESLGMSHKESGMHQSMKDRRDESKGTEKFDNSRAYSRVQAMDAEMDGGKDWNMGLTQYAGSAGGSGQGTPVNYGGIALPETAVASLVENSGDNPLDASIGTVMGTMGAETSLKSKKSKNPSARQRGRAATQGTDNDPCAKSDRACPKDKALWQKSKQRASKEYRVWPSPHASAYAVQLYNQAGGKWSGATKAAHKGAKASNLGKNSLTNYYDGNYERRGDKGKAVDFSDRKTHVTHGDCGRAYTKDMSPAEFRKSFPRCLPQSGAAGMSSRGQTKETLKKRARLNKRKFRGGKGVSVPVDRKAGSKKKK